MLNLENRFGTFQIPNNTGEKVYAVFCASEHHKTGLYQGHFVFIITGLAGVKKLQSPPH